jgi:hypothetical protein
VPEPPAVRTIQLALLLAVHAQVLVVETSTVPASPNTPTLTLRGEIE